MTTVTLLASLPSEAAVLAAYRSAGGTIGDVLATSASALMIDGDAAPIEPEWAVKGKTVHIPCGQVDPSSLVFFQTEEMKNGSGTLGTNLSDKTRQAKLKPTNANACVFLEQNQAFLAKMPQNINCLIFPETRFLVRFGSWCFRCLDRNDGRWVFNVYRVDYRYNGQDAVVAFGE